MTTYLFFTLGVLSSWLIFFSILLYLVLTKDKSFNFIVFNKKQLLKHWIYISFMLGVSYYIFCLRLNRRGISINLFEVWQLVEELIYSLSLINRIILAFILIMMLIFGFLFMKLVYIHLRRCLLALYLYYFQFDTFQKICFKHVHIGVHFQLYLMNRISIFTNNSKIINLGFWIWPGLFYVFIEPMVFRFILPYLFIFDYITQDGNIYHIFIILPWYYMYMIIRSSWNLFGSFFKQGNTDISQSVYKKGVDIYGNLVRWIDLSDFAPKNKETWEE